MQAHFQMTAGEFTACMRTVTDEATRKAMATNSFFRWVGPVLVVFAIGAALNWSEDRLLHQVSWVIMVVCGLLIWGAFHRLQIGVLNSVVTEGGFYTQPTTVEISPDSFVYCNRFARTVLHWTAIRRIEETEQHLTVFIDNLVVYFIPKCAFGTQAEFQAFFDKAQRWAGAASGPWASDGRRLGSWAP